MLIPDQNAPGMMRDAFIELALAYKVLQFGSFTLKSGRVSPYFFNMGLFNDGRALKLLGDYYAALYHQHHLHTAHLFGPAYKGIWLAGATAMALSEKLPSITVTCNRKEPKLHGEGGLLIGAPLTGPTTIIDDVITAGTAIREAIHFIQTHGGVTHSVLIALDRCERGSGSHSTIAEIQAMGIQVFSLITLFDIIDYLRREGQGEQAAQLEAYQASVC